MRDDPTPRDLQLPRRGLYSVTDAAGVQFSCTEGLVWITLDNDTRDIVLEAGQQFTGDSHRRALVYAMRPSALRITGPREAEAARTRHSRNSTIDTFSAFQAMPLAKAAR